MGDSNPGLYYNFVPTAGQWNSYFSGKQDYSPVLDTLISQGGAAPYISPTGWTPIDVSGGGLVFTSVSAEYVVIGNIVVAFASLTFPTTSSPVDVTIGGLPYSLPNSNYAATPQICYVVGAAATLALPVIGSTTLTMFALATGAAVINSTLSAKALSFNLTYPLV